MKNNLQKELTEKISNDQFNKEYTKKGYLPVFKVSNNSKILIIGQAPGIKAQEKGIAWDDKSGQELRKWLNVSKEQFYNSDYFGIIPMDFYFPGKGKTGDLPPRKGFAEKWHPIIFNNLNNIKLIILVGNYALKYYLKDKYNKNLTTTVKNYKNYLPLYFPLVHPSPLNFRWQNKNKWFKEEVVPELQKIVKEILNI